MNKWLQPALASLVLAVALVVRYEDPGLLKDLRLLVFDQYQRIVPREYHPQPVKIIDVDDASIARFGQWPWPRSVIATLIKKLHDKGAAVIAFDMVFPEPDRTAPSRVYNNWDIPPSDPLVKELQARVKDPDAVLAEELTRGNAVLGLVMTSDGKPVEVKRKGGFAIAGLNPTKQEGLVPDFAGVLTSIPELRDAARGNGAINPVPDRDAIVRRVPMLLTAGYGKETRLYPSLVAEALRVGFGAGSYIVKATGSQTYNFAVFRNFVRQTPGIGELGIGPLKIKTDPRGELWLYDTGRVADRYISAWQVLEDKGPDLTGHVVFVGTSAAGLLDLRSTPNAAIIPGVEIHAQIVEQIMTGNLIERPLWADDLEFAALLVLGLAMIFLLPKLGAVGCAILGAASIAAAVGYGWWAFLQLHWLLDPVYPSAGAGAVFLAGVLLSFRRSDMERKRVRETFSHYLAPAMVKRLVANPGLLKLGGEVRDLTIMFCDIRDFTTISERMEASALTALLNDFLTPMTEAVLAHDGTIDKYIGDSIMAFWNAPLDAPDHAVLACRATLEMRRQLSLLNARLAAEAAKAGQAHHPIMIGIGLNSGPAMVGNLGARQRLNYSVIGDNVNLASRIEGVSKNFGVDILIGEQTRAAAPDLAAIPIGDIFVKGKTVPARLYALIGGPEVMRSPNATALLDAIAEAAHAFKAGKLDAVAAALDRAKQLGGGLNLEPLFEHMTNALASAKAKAA
ncbi:MAG TPA: adenylate/guanylate cyclase domain-containing protein [Dongiaceae bacterium]|nr:adenylate/guanylate cyclase domain-containing protein [Dongiaceae bacterium]